MIPATRSTLRAFRQACLITIVLMTASAPAAIAQTSTLMGRVVEEGSERPVSTADLELHSDSTGVSLRGLTAEDGSFSISIPDGGVYSLAVRRVGYATIVAEELDIEADENIELLIRLSPDAIPLEAVTVVARAPREPYRLVEFRQRAEQNQRLGLGRIYMREDLERYTATTAQDMLSGLTISSTCRPLVLLDGLPTDERIFGITMADVEGIEIYRGINQIPPQYYRYGMCGLTMVWTRADTPDGRPLTWRRAVTAGGILGILLLLMK